VLQLGKNCLIILDNASYHRSGQTIQRYEEFGMQIAYNVAYSPSLNAIERFFSLVKRS
jgi:transposase